MASSKPTVQTALILAAGFGRRMENLTKDTPKPLLSVWGKPLIDHILIKLKAYGVKRVMVNAHYLSEQIVTHIEPWKHHFADLIILQEPTLLGGGGTILRAASMLPDNTPFFTINGDVLWKEREGPTLGYLDATWQAHGQPVLALVRKENAWGYKGSGDFILDEAGLVHPKPSKLSEAPYVYSGIQLLTPGHLKEDPVKLTTIVPLEVYPLWRGLIKRKLLRGCLFPDPWYHVGSKPAYQKIGHL